MTMISMDNIYLEVAADNYQEVLTKIGKLLQKKGYVKESYTEALLEREEMSPTGLPLSPWSVAIPHTDPEHVIQPCLIVFQLKELVLFNEMANPTNQVPVKYVFGLVFSDGKKQLKLLSDIIALTQNKQLMTTLFTSKSKEEIYKGLKMQLSEMKEE
ncbi:PTS sugar transporter subunit IIA [Enterococcus hulanensis]|uniref:PTS sugar transporter subunit IIA n=1 Tax=Enterococcus hulanensis TaxID=2559929 RepID=UPI002890E849|nr:PTS sugar transporter subunit IIA [Enterococcus hulanensis]MDT2659791.1 PTS sugar transporter subunit IIA [Enterococcus hulanensis]